MKRIFKDIREKGVSYIGRKLEAKIRLKFGGRSPLVSIVMPVYNAEKYLEQAIDSLLEQSIRHIEIIAVDDGSTDRSLEILNRYAAADKRVCVFTQKNQYAGVARNLGMKNATGEYIIFLDSDDFFDKDLVKESYYQAKINRADIGFYGANYYDNETGKSWRGQWLLAKSFIPKKQPFNYKDCPDTIYQISIECPWTKIFRREFIVQNDLKFQDLYNANDVYFVLCAISMAERIVTLDKALVNYRIGLKNNLQSSSKRCFYEALSAWHDKLVELDRLETVRKSYVSCALGGCIKNLWVVKDFKEKKQIYDKLKYEAFDSLELFGYEPSFYHNRKYYEEMLRVKNNSFEQYMEMQKES